MCGICREKYDILKEGKEVKNMEIRVNFSERVNEYIHTTM